MAKMGTRTQIIEQPANADEKWLMDTASELAEKAGIGMPQVGIFPSQEANAFATGWNRNNALVAGLGPLQRFTRDEVKAVMAHEIAVANGDMVNCTDSGRGKYLRDVLCSHCWLCSRQRKLGESGRDDCRPAAAAA